MMQPHNQHNSTHSASTSAQESVVNACQPSVSVREYIRSITLDEASFLRRAPEIESERSTAISDLLAENSFQPRCMCCGPYDIHLSVREQRLHMRIASDALHQATELNLTVAPFKRIIKDYFLICESYFEATKANNAFRIEAIDMGRRGIHNEGSELLQNILHERIVIDFDTARRLFTLLCVLHIKA